MGIPILEKPVLRFIKIARKLFRNTWIHKIPLTSKLYSKLFSAVYGNVEKEIVFRNIKLLVPTKDTSMVPSIINQDYETLELDIYKQVLKPGYTVLDIGANLGIYTIIGAKIVGSSGKIHSFEPVPENLKFLRHNVKLNQCNNVTIVPVALGEDKGKADIYIAEKNVGTHSMGQYKSAKNSIKIDVDTVEEYVAKNRLKVDLVKMDVEGFEGYVLRGAGKALNKSIVLTEFTNSRLIACGDSPTKVARSLLNTYKYCYVIDEKDHKLVLANKVSKIAKLENSNLLLSNKKLSINL